MKKTNKTTKIAIGIFLALILALAVSCVVNPSASAAQGSRQGPRALVHALDSQRPPPGARDSQVHLP